MMGLKAKLPNGELVDPAPIGIRYYGTDRIPPDVAFEEGIPLKGICNDLYKHVLGNPNSAFRGTTERPVISHYQEQGAIYWAEHEGWVYTLGLMEGWDAERLLEGVVPTAGGFTGSPHIGELECAIDSRVSPQLIQGANRVFKSRRFLELGEWIENKNYQKTK